MATYGTSNGYINYSVNSTESNVDINSNTSVITVWVDVWRTNTGYTTSGSGTVYVWIDGAQYFTPISSSQKITSTPIRLCTFARTIGHNNDGSRSVGVSAQINHDRFSTGNNGYTHNLTTIPRASSIDSFSCSTNYVDGKYTVKYTPKYAFTYKLRLSVPSVYAIKTINLGTQSTGQKTATATFTTSELETLYKKYPKTDHVIIGAVIETWSGSTKIGESTELKKTLYFPTSLKPTFDSATLSPINYNSYINWDIYIQNNSHFKVTFNSATGVYGSTIKSYIVNGNEYSSNNMDAGVLTSNGDKEIKVKVKDTRGRVSEEKTYTINIVPYEPPKVNTLTINRCGSNGNIDNDNGQNLIINVNAEYTKIANNTMTLNAFYKAKEDSEYIRLSSINNNIDKIYTSPIFDIAKAYDIKIVATDLVYGEVYTFGILEDAKAIIDVLKGGNGIAFGKMASKEDTVEINENWNLEVHGQEIDERYAPNISYSIPVAYTKRGSASATSTINWFYLCFLSTGDTGCIFNHDYAELYAEDGTSAYCVEIKVSGWYKVYYSGRWSDNSSYSSYLATGSRMLGVSVNNSKTDDWAVWSHLLHRLSNNGTSILYLNKGDHINFTAYSQQTSTIKNIEIYIEKIG